MKDLKIMQLQELNQKLVDNEKVTAQFQEANQQLQRQNQELRKHYERLKGQLPEPPQDIVLQWRDGGKTPFPSERGSSVVAGNVAYFSSGSKIYSYDSSSRRWNNLPECPQEYGSLAIVKDLLTMVGGYLTSDHSTTNKLVSLTEDGKWVEQFPPMPTDRRFAIAISYQNNLVVAGGANDRSLNITAVEILNTDTLVWSTAASLPHSFGRGSATIVSGHLYMLGGSKGRGVCQELLSCSLAELLQSCKSSSELVSKAKRLKRLEVWQSDVDTPVHGSTCTTVNEALVSIGGSDKDGKDTTAVYKYDANTQSWAIISHITVARHLCYVVFVGTTHQLIVIGGFESGSHTKSVEIADVY